MSDGLAGLSADTKRKVRMRINRSLRSFDGPLNEDRQFVYRRFTIARYRQEAGHVEEMEAIDTALSEDAGTMCRNTSCENGSPTTPCSNQR